MADLPSGRVVQPFAKFDDLAQHLMRESFPRQPEEYPPWW
jgi:hypothetical protein